MRIDIYFIIIIFPLLLFFVFAPLGGKGLVLGMAEIFFFCGREREEREKEGRKKRNIHHI